MTYKLARETVLSAAADRGLFTIVSLSDASGVSRLALHQALRLEGATTPSLRTVMRLARTLQIPLDELVQDAA